ncbi:MAG: hypothetical protein H7Z75_19255 [Ferruginibacter sp.]|nr:hypothetical protein [Cytophagales bacterium]
MRKIKNFKEISVLIGVIAGFTFLISFFAGIGVPTETIFVSGIFFAVITIAITPVLLTGEKTKGKPQ